MSLRPVTNTEANKIITSLGTYRGINFSGTQGILASSKLRRIENAWKDYPRIKSSNEFYSCYGSYFGVNSVKGPFGNPEKFYASYPSVPLWFPEIVEELNNFYDNINIKIISNKNIGLSFKKIVFPEWEMYNNQTNIKEKITGVELFYNFTSKPSHLDAFCPIVEFEYNSGYSPIAKYYFNYSLVILLRILSHCEKHLNPFYKPQGKKLNYLIYINNKFKGYRSFSETEITKKGLKNYDNIELVNEQMKFLLNVNFSIRQTDIYCLINKKYENIKNRALSERIES